MGKFVKKKKEILDREYFEGQRYRLLHKKERLNLESLLLNEAVEDDFFHDDLESQMSSDAFDQEFGLKRIRRFDADLYDLWQANQRK